MNEADNPIRITLIAPGPTLRVGLRALLESDPGVEIVAEAASLQDIEVTPHHPDILIIAVWDSPARQLELILQDRSRPKAILFLTNQPNTLSSVLDKPNLTIGILSIESSREQILAALRAVGAGLNVIMPAFEMADPMKITAVPEGSTTSTEPLTDRELEVLQWIAQGLPNKQIALKLGISENTVKYHISSIYGKLGVNSRTEAVRAGARLGLVTL